MLNSPEAARAVEMREQHLSPVHSCKQFCLAPQTPLAGAEGDPTEGSWSRRQPGMNGWGGRCNKSPDHWVVPSFCTQASQREWLESGGDGVLAPAATLAAGPRQPAEGKLQYKHWPLGGTCGVQS